MSPVIGNPLRDLPTGTVRARPPAQGGARLNAPGLVARLRRIPGVTPKAVLAHQIYLPAVLNTPILSESALHNDYDTLSAGEFSQPAMGGPDVVTQLRDLPLDTLTLAWDAKWIVVSGQNPLQLRDTLTRILRSRKPVHLLLFFHPHPSPWAELDMNVTLRQATREIRPGEHDTRYMTFTLKEWRDPRIARNSSRPSSGGSSRKKGVTLPATKQLLAGDTLDSLAKEFYGSYAQWRLIRDANGIPTRWGQKSPLVNLPGRFKTGYKITIPALPSSSSGGAGLGG